jgi:hypothetical protein
MANRLLHLGYADAFPAAELLSHPQRLQTIFSACRDAFAPLNSGIF